jgi:hypothetical protein
MEHQKQAPPPSPRQVEAERANTPRPIPPPPRAEDFIYHERIWDPFKWLRR